MYVCVYVYVYEYVYVYVYVRLRARAFVYVCVNAFFCMCPNILTRGKRNVPGSTRSGIVLPVEKANSVVSGPVSHWSEMKSALGLDRADKTGDAQGNFKCWMGGGEREIEREGERQGGREGGREGGRKGGRE